MKKEKHKITFPKLVVTYHKWNKKDDMRHIPYSGKAMDAIKELILRRMNEKEAEQADIDVPSNWGVSADKLVVKKAYQNSDKDKPYIQVFTGKGWEKHQRYKKNHL